MSHFTTRGAPCRSNASRSTAATSRAFTVLVGLAAIAYPLARSRTTSTRPSRLGVLLASTGTIVPLHRAITSTEWGKVLLLKLAAVAAAAALGAYNHFRLRPALDAAPDDPGLNVVVRNTLTAEAILLLFVVVVTSALVAASAI